MRIYSFVQKDILTTKFYFVASVIITITLPIFFHNYASEYLGFSSLLLTVLFSEFSIFQAISAIDAKYPKALAHLLATPYSRDEYAASKYLLHIAICLFCFASTIICYIILAGYKGVSVNSTTDYLLSFFISSIIFSVYIPVEFWWGYEKTRYTFLLVVFCGTFSVKYLSGLHYTWLMDLLAHANSVVIVVLSLTLSFVTIYLSYRLSCHCLKRKDF